MAQDPSIPEYNLGRYVEKWCQVRPDQDIIGTIVDGALQAVTYRQMLADTGACATLFQSKGVKAGDRVVMIASKCPRHFNFFFACWYMGAIAVPVCETMGEQEMAFVLADCDPALILVENSFLPKVRKAAPERQILDLDELPTGTPIDSPRTPPATNVALDDVATIIYTSGSTGMPKGVMLTNRNLYVNAFWCLKKLQQPGVMRIVSVLPYWHSYALVCEIICMTMGTHTCLLPRDLRDFKNNLANYRPTIMIAVPRVVEIMKQSIEKVISKLPERKRKLVDKAIYNASRIFTARPVLDGGILRMVTHHLFYDPLVFRKFRAAFGGQLKSIVVGGAPMDLEGQIFFKYLGVMVLVGYGLTETSPVVCSNLVTDHKLNSCGKILPWLTPEYGGDYTFKDDEGHLGKDVHGQLLVKGNCVMKGYWNHKDASAKTFEDGWLNTGDVAYQDSDGFIHIDGRKGNMIVLVGGEKFHPEFVEDAIRGNAPTVSEVMVIGERCKNIYACVNVHRDKVAGLSEQEIHAKVKQEIQKATASLTMLERPKDVLVLPDFKIDDGTLTATLKIRRYKVRELYKAQIEAFLTSNGEDVAHEVAIASSKIMQSI